MSPEKKIKTWLPLWVGLGIALGILIGSIYSQFGNTGKVDGTGKIDAIFNYINKSYVDTVNIRQLVEEALPKIVQELDPHSAYISASEMKRLNEDLEGHFSGIGVSFYVLSDTIVVTSIVPGGPSEAAGIQQWDRIVNVNDTLIAGRKITNADVLQKLRGEKGSEVKLGIKRNDDTKLIDITVTRGDIPMNSVQAAYMQTNTIGYIKVGTFGFNTFNEFISALSKLKSQGAHSFVIDLRGNSGGSLEIVVAMVNEFLHKGDLIVYADGRNFPRQDSYANGSGTSKEDDVVILIDELSASASEIFAGAIQDNDRGLVMGRRSFGKGLVQSQRNFPDGSAVRLTVARYYTPSGRSIQRKYEKGKYDEYELEALNRYMQGDYVNSDTASTLIPFKTEGGRTVFGGDGIMPDVFIARDTIGMNSYFNTIANKDFIQEYAVTYSDMHKHKLSEFQSAEDLARHLYKQPLLMNLVSYADNKGVRPRPYYIEESRKLFERHLVAYIVRNFFGEESYFSVYMQDDVLMKNAVDFIERGLAKPESVVQEKYKSISLGLRVSFPVPKEFGSLFYV
ncbi:MULTISPECIES: S41 family peptidase [Dysgonomonadaceae]|jgi:carboxyl-terminal processing protease|uniref:S41 family peptidase n=1 Tax=Dysgonomonadaceae TaxID=2005520 RepID=UPI000E836B0D|nr:S41 family peptidase [Proteiniphilum sp. UBA7639]MDD2311207.1 S41 family peptidase [Petrimonas sp.]HBK40323.1 peptidase S41 [Porphyromonadaceae bacterium]MDD4015021.1 S41 family peptidase [Petrimonas sp.]MDD4537281.1 S41 family peptidase [Petrimonas sp.]HOI77985.1 S41 family peptidase [Petrimonas sp.]